MNPWGKYSWILLQRSSWRQKLSVLRWRQGWSRNVTISVGKGSVPGGGGWGKKRALVFLPKCIDREGLGRRRTGTRQIPPLEIRKGWNTFTYKCFPRLAKATVTTLKGIQRFKYPVTARPRKLPLTSWRFTKKQGNKQTEPGAHNLERATSMYSCHGVLRTSLFLERFWREFRISLKSHKPVSKPTDLKTIIFALYM